jgi:hypothetical protein
MLLTLPKNHYSHTTFTADNAEPGQVYRGLHSGSYYVATDDQRMISLEDGHRAISGNFYHCPDAVLYPEGE